jgi:hypothetical protein
MFVPIIRTSRHPPDHLVSRGLNISQMFYAASQKISTCPDIAIDLSHARSFIEFEAHEAESVPLRPAAPFGLLVARWACSLESKDSVTLACLCLGSVLSVFLRPQERRIEAIERPGGRTNDASRTQRAREAR